jgi:hypothetical protein
LPNFIIVSFGSYGAEPAARGKILPVPELAFRMRPVHDVAFSFPAIAEYSVVVQSTHDIDIGSCSPTLLQARKPKRFTQTSGPVFAEMRPFWTRVGRTAGSDVHRLEDWRGGANAQEPQTFTRVGFRKPDAEALRASPSTLVSAIKISVTYPGIFAMTPEKQGQ